MIRAPSSRAFSPEQPDVDVGAIFDEEFAKLFGPNGEPIGKSRGPVLPVDPEAAAAAKALNDIFSGDYNLTADLSFEQVYAKALPHFITIMKHVLASMPPPDPEKPE
jgi:hypothetical protein